ncbi:MAG: CHAT domain-containing protein, partial [Cyanobacteriota bacterium]|nr:CHAT domain-containing protein [Cyanobacteriota bacterium]
MITPKRKKLGFLPQFLRFLRILVCCCLIVVLAHNIPIFGAETSTVLTVAESPASGLEQGRRLFEAGRFAEAIAIWQQTLAEFEAKGDIINQAMVLNNLAAAWGKLAEWEQAKNAITSSRERLNTLSPTPQKQRVLAQNLNTQGNLQFQTGQLSDAAISWKQATQVYQQINFPDGIIQTTINQSLALQGLGQYPQALRLLRQISGSLSNCSDFTIKAVYWRSLGNILRFSGELEASKMTLEKALEIAETLNSPQLIAEAKLSLANTERAIIERKYTLNFKESDSERVRKAKRQIYIEQLESPLNLYQETVKTATSPFTQVQAKLNQLSLFIDSQQWSKAEIIWEEFYQSLQALSINSPILNSYLNLAENLIKFSQADSQYSHLSFVAAQLLADTAQKATQIQDIRSQAYALGKLGQLYEQKNQFKMAEQLTRQANQLISQFSEPEVTYLWEWQLGRILKAQGDREGATLAYTAAFNTLQSLRKDLANINPYLQFSFQEQVEPVYRQLVSLLLNSRSTQEDLKLARIVMESLRTVELENFFKEACLQVQSASIDQVDNQAAVIYPIILPERLEIIVSFPNQALQHYTTPLSQQQLETIIQTLQQQISTPKTFETEYLANAQQLYNWIIRPIQKELELSSVQTLVFVLDSFLRNIPMAILHDGEKFLIENYGISLAPGLQLIDINPLKINKLAALIAGLSEAQQGFPALPSVPVELEKVSAELPNQQFLNQDFTKDNIQQALNKSNFPIIHLATHGSFSSSPEDTFLLTWDDRINVRELNDLLQNQDRRTVEKIELLVLSACETALGDKQAALGLAGVAVRAGTRSTLASLWSVDDQATA